jgi:thiol-disulfide isomerase/thioredoxin
MSRRGSFAPARVLPTTVALLLLPVGGWAAGPAQDPALVSMASDTVKAAEVLAAGLQEAAATDRLVFLHSGAPWCGWCKRLERWLEREDIAPVFTRDFVAVKIDVDEMEGGKELMDRYTGGYRGVPFLVILGADGTVLADSFTPDRRNIGSPRAEWEIEHWNVMMRATVRRITDEEIAYMARTWAEDGGENLPVQPVTELVRGHMLNTERPSRP